jgi:hypothetical protein
MEISLHTKVEIRWNLEQAKDYFPPSAHTKIFHIQLSMIYFLQFSSSISAPLPLMRMG